MGLGRVPSEVFKPHLGTSFLFHSSGLPVGDQKASFVVFLSGGVSVDLILWLLLLIPMGSFIETLWVLFSSDTILGHILLVWGIVFFFSH